MHLKHHQHCRICGTTLRPDDLVLDLGEMNIQGYFVKEGDRTIPTRKIPNQLVQCPVENGGCGLVQTRHSVPSEILYSSYWYKSGVSQTMRDHLGYIVKQAVEMLGGADKLDILDVAANDGTLLEKAELSGHFNKLIGVDPSNVAKINSRRSDIKIINDYFPSNQIRGYFDVITSIAVLYDIDELNEFVNDIKMRLKDGGIWIFEVAYLPLMIRNMCYDTIVAEHVSHFHLAPLESLLEEFGLEIFRAETNDTNGGSILCFVKKMHKEVPAADNPNYKEQLHKLRMMEFNSALDDPNKILRDWQEQIINHKTELLKILTQYDDFGQGKIHLYGASTKANTLIQFCGVEGLLEKAAERSHNKHGMKTLYGLPIVSEEESRADKPDAYLVGPWHFKKEIIEREQETIRSGIDFIFPLPKVEVVNKENLDKHLNKL